MTEIENRRSQAVAARVRIVLNEPQNLINIGAVVRAMSNMGLARLYLVNPGEFDAHRIIGIAHRCDHLLDASVTVDTLDEALDGATYVIGASARARTAQRNYRRPRPVATEIVDRAMEGEEIAVVFGREDRGLDNYALDRCHDVLVIPTDASYSSLNLAQAFLLIAYEIHMVAEDGGRPMPRSRRSLGPAPHEELERMYDALGAGLDHIDFFKVRKMENVMRTLRTALSRCGLDLHEAKLIQAIGYEIRHFVTRARSAGIGEEE